jgi:hypothetical protein
MPPPSRTVVIKAESRLRRRSAVHRVRNCIPGHTVCPAGEGARLTTGG